MPDNINDTRQEAPLKPTVLDAEDIGRMVPFLGRHPRLLNRLIKMLQLDKVNRLHAENCHTPGPGFVRGCLHDLDITVVAENGEVLRNLPEGAFITVSNHPFGALDGIALIHIIGSRRPEFKVLVNMILNQITAMRPNFIAVDPLASTDPSKRSVSVNGIRQALRQLSDGNPVGFFPAGAMSKTTLRHGLQDREWQKSVLQIIHRAKVPVIPIFFHGGNSWWCNLLGHICWPARSLRLPAEVFRKVGTEIHISVGDPISPAEQALHAVTPETLGKFLREKTYELSKLK